MRGNFIHLQRNVFKRSICKQVDFLFYVSYLLAMSWLCSSGNLELSEMRWRKDIVFSYELRV